MENFIYLKNIKKDKLEEKNFIKYINEYISKNKKIFVIMVEDEELYDEFNNINELNVTYKIEKLEHKSKESGKIIVIDIDENNIKFIKDKLIEWKETNKIKKIFITQNTKGIIEINIKDSECIISKMLITKKMKIFIAIFLLFITLLGGVNYKYRIVNHVDSETTIGIIDGEYTLKYDNTIYNTSPKESQEKTHGDNMLIFANDVADKIKIYYYDATNTDGKIDSNNIILGLDYMKKNNVKVVNISLSSKKYSSEIENWIKNNPEIKIYASYNNLINTYDYPAMYDGVIGSGKKENIEYKEIDNQYSTNEIIVLPNVFKIYNGNSYLSLYDAIKNK